MDNTSHNKLIKLQQCTLHKFLRFFIPKGKIDLLGGKQYTVEKDMEEIKTKIQRHRKDWLRFQKHIGKFLKTNSHYNTGGSISRVDEKLMASSAWLDRVEVRF